MFSWNNTRFCCCKSQINSNDHVYSTITPIASQLAESTGRVWLLLSLWQVCERGANWQLKHLASSLPSKSSECWGEHGFTNHPFRNRDRNWQVGRAVVSGVKITLKRGAQWAAEWASLWMVNAMGVTVHYIHVGNQTSVFWRRVNTFVLWKMKIFDVDLNSDWPQVSPRTKSIVHVRIWYPLVHKWTDYSLSGGISAFTLVVVLILKLIF